MIVTDFDLHWALVSKHLNPMVFGNNTYAFHCDNIIKFINKVDNKIVSSFYHANGELTGNGVTVIAGHKYYPIIAFAENCLKPNIYIILYPSLKRVQTLTGDNVLRYIAMCFSDSEYLVALTGYPNQLIKIWNFRAGHMLIEQVTEINTDCQYLSCGNGLNSFCVSQYAPILKTLYIWEVHPCMDQAFLIRRVIKIPFLKRNFKMNHCFGVDGQFYCIDKIGNLYSAQQANGVVKEQWSWNGDIGEDMTNICVYRGGFLICGSSNEFKFIKKIQNAWIVQWTLKDMKETMVWLSPASNYEKIFGLDENSTLYCLVDTKDELTFEQYGEKRSVIRFIDLIYPLSTHLAIVNSDPGIKIIDIVTADQISYINSIQNITMFCSHPDQPYSVVGDTFGTIFFLSFYELESPKIVTKFKLGISPIVNNSVFTSNFLIVSDEINDYYSIQLNKESPYYEVFNRVSVPEYYVWSLSALDIGKSLCIFLLISENISEEPNELLVIKTLKLKHVITKNIINLEYQCSMICVTRSGILLAVPQIGLSIQIKKFNDTLTAFDKTLLKRNLHQIGPIKIRSSFHTLTWGPDGLICIYDSDLKVSKFLLGHGRGLTEDSIQTVRCTRNTKHCLALSKRGVLKCFVQSDYKDTLLKMPDLKNYFGSESLTADVPEKSWLEEKAEAELQRDVQTAAQAKNSILNDFKVIKNKVQLLIDDNERQNELATLDMHHFNLDKEWWNQKLIEGRKLQEFENQTLVSYLNDQLRITDWIKCGTWDLMETKGCKIRGIFIHAACDNYPLPFIDKRKFQEQLNFILMRRQQEMQLASEDSFYPWIWKVEKPEIDSTKSTHSIKSIKDNLLEGSTADSVSVKADLTQYQTSGTSGHLFIRPHPSRYLQIELVFFNQLHIETILGQCDIQKLKEYFNALFSEMQKTKKLQVDDVNRRNERLRHIQSEMNIMQTLRDAEPSNNWDIIDPVFRNDENPEKIVTVDASEISVLPYISPSRQKLLDEIAYAAELRRLALLADDFRDRALMAMMDGVLEKLWEDEIKKNIPLPDCYEKNKDPFNYTKEDHMAIKDYEEKVAFLKSERLRYETILQDEKLKIDNYQDEQILKFNAKCEGLIQVKYQVDLAIKEEESKLLLMSLYNIKRQIMRTENSDLKIEINNSKAKIIEFQKAIANIEKVVADCKIKFEQAQTKDRLLERQFKLQFSESAAPFLVDQAYRIFKKRPKWPHRAWGTAVVFNELANRIIRKDNVKRGIPLPEECFDYLNAVDAVDNYALAPNTIDTRLWEILCKMRRHKIESEFKLRASGAQLAEAESTYNNFIKEVNLKKLKLVEKEKKFQEKIQTYNEYTQNRYVQLVLPMGQIEIGLTGFSIDFDKCILLSTTDVDDINNIIKKAGMKKLNAMHKVAMFRRKVIFKEWEHKVLQMSVQDLKDFLYVIEHSKITFDILQVLRQKVEKRLPDLSTAKLNRDIEHQLNYLQKSITEINTTIAETRAKIEEVQKSNAALDVAIQSLNVAVTNQNINRDVLLEELELRQQKERLNMIFERGKLMRQVQAGHAHIMELATLLELQRLRTFPTLNVSKPCPV